MIQAAFFDIDGTILDHTDMKSVFPESTKQSLAALQRKGIKVFISTGRAPYMLDGRFGVRSLFPFDGYCTMNGQLVLEADGAVIHTLSHNPEDVLGLVDLVQDHPLPAFIQEADTSFPLIDHPFVRRHFEWMGEPFPALYDPARLAEHPVLQFNIFMDPKEAAQILKPLKHIEITSSGGDILDVIPRGGGKEMGLAAVVKHYGFTQENTIAFGDGPNDIRMLQWAGTGVAMGNATEDVKAIADYITTPVFDNGVKNALLHLGILTPEDF